MDSADNNSILTTQTGYSSLVGFGLSGLTTSLTYEADDLIRYDNIGSTHARGGSRPIKGHLGYSRTMPDLTIIPIPVDEW